VRQWWRALTSGRRKGKSGFDIGLGSPGARQHLDFTLQIVRIIDQLDDMIPAFPHEMLVEGSEFAQLATEAPDAPVDLPPSIRVALMTARGTVDSIAASLTGKQGTHAIAIQALTRAALISAGRVVFALAPTDLEQRQRNVRTVLAQESYSLIQGMNAFAKFEGLASLRLPAEIAESVREVDRGLRDGNRPRGEGRTLNDMADELTRMLSSFGDVGSGLNEHVEWVFHAYSGAAHGFAWPWEYFAAAGALPGDFVADFGGVVPLVQLAFQTTLERMQQPAEPRPEATDEDQ